MSIEGFFPRGTGGGSGDPATVARSVENKTKIDEVSKTAGQTVAAGQVTLNYGKIWKNDTAGALTVGAHEAGMVAEGFTESTQEQIDEIVVSTTDLAGAAPAGAKEGINTTTGAEFYVMAGNWVASPVAADLPRLPSLQASADFTPDIPSSVSMADLEKLVRNHTPQMFPADPNTKDIVLKVAPIIGHKEYILTFGANVTFTDAPAGVSTAGGNHVSKMRWEGPGGTNQDGWYVFCHKNTDGTIIKARLKWANGAVLGDWEIAADISQTELDALNAHVADADIHVTAVQKTAWDAKEDELPKDTALRFLRRNAANDGWELTDIVVTSQNLTSGPGIPGAADGNDGDYWLQLDAALGSNDIWGPKAGGAWPAQADFKSADPEETTPAQAVSTTGTDYTTPRLWSTENQDQWGQSRRVQRIFNSGPIFDYSTLNYIDKTAIFVRNPDNANGINLDAGAGVSVEVTNADGSIETVTQNANIQPGEIGVFEKDGTNARLNVFPGERVKRFASYAAANAFGPLPFDGLVLITDKREIWARISATNTEMFPADGVPNAHWDVYGADQKDPQSLLLDYILVNVRSSGTNASSSVSITFTDNDGNDYPHADWVYSADLLQYAGGTATIVTDKAAWSGTLGIGHNKQGSVKFYYIGDNPNGTSVVAGAGANGGETQDVSFEYQGTNYSDTFASAGAVSGPLYWTTSQQVEATDQAAPLVEATEYLAGSVFSAPEPDNTDADYQTWFNWRVNDGETIADTDIPTGTEAELLAVKSKLTRFGVGSTTGIDWVEVGDTNPFQKGVVNYQKSSTDTGVAPALSPNEDYAVARKNAQGNYDFTQYFHDGDGVQTIENAAASTKWVYSTDGMNAVDGDKIIVAPDHTINLTDVTDLASIEFAPSTGNWADIQAGTGSFSPDAAWTFGSGQTLPYGSDVLRVVSNLGNTNWLLFTGGEDAPSQDQRYATVPDLPAIATVSPGAMGVVYNDPTPANNRTYIARTDGIDSAVAVAWA